MNIVHVPERHVCDGFSGHTNGAWSYPGIEQPIRRPEGTVKQCECGRTWVAGSIPGYMASVWRREGRFERWLRTRKQRRGK